MDTRATFSSAPTAAATIPFAPHWTAQDIADAVPQRLFELFAFDAGPDGARPGRCADRGRRRPWHHGYLPPHDLPAFVRIHS